MKKLRIVGIDVSKQVCHLVGMDEQGTILERKRLYRAQVMVCIAQPPPPCPPRAGVGPHATRPGSCLGS